MTAQPAQAAIEKNPAILKDFALLFLRFLRFRLDFPQI
jgi:hypothetical protein